MPGLGTAVDALFIIIGGLIGMTFGRKLSERYQETMLSACGLSILFIGIGGVMSQMLVFADGSFTTEGSVMLASSLTIGAFLGEAADIERQNRMNRLPP